MKKLFNVDEIEVFTRYGCYVLVNTSKKHWCIVGQCNGFKKWMIKRDIQKMFKDIDIYDYIVMKRGSKYE